ncbi:MAG TPA: CBS domain-containing protein [Candidatus Angelobacter sp.]|nr:CBS domain-containing protein [Candidatus Angelobacter sp.]
MKVREIMTSEGLATAALDTTLAEIAERMRDENVGAIPIVDDDDKLCGIITDRDIVVRAVAEGEDPSECTAEEILSGQLHTIDPEAELEEVADLMARHQIRRLPVVEDEMVIGMISLGDLAVKSEEDEAADVLEDVSEGVRQAQQSGRQTSGREQSQNRGTSQRAGNVDTQLKAADRSPGEEVAEEEAEYQRRSSGRQAGGRRAESANAGRVRNQSQSQQSIANDIVDVEGEEEPDFQNAGGGLARQRANRQQQQGVRGRQNESIRGRQSGELRESSGSKRSQGISNRSQKEENQRQQKVTPMRAESRSTGRGGKNKRKAS